MKTLFSFAAILFATATFAQVTTETRTVGDFTGLRYSSAYDVEISQGDACAVSIVGEASDIKQITTEVSDGVLLIAGKMPKENEDLVIKVTVKNLHLLDVSGASETTTTNQLTTDSLQIIGSGASAVKIDVKATSIKTNLSGASDVKLSGTTVILEAALSGASELKSYSLTADKVVVTTSGASDAHVSPVNVLTATATGASDIHYQGNPINKTIDFSSSASISKRDGDQTSSPNDTTNIHMGKFDVHVTECDGDDDERSDREKKADNNDFNFWQGADFGVAGYTTFDNQVNLPASMKFLELNYAKSYVFGVNAYQKNIHIYRNNINLATGIGATWYHYNFRNSYSLTPNVPYATATYDSLNYKHNRLNMCYLNVPLFLEFNTNNDDASKSFHFGAGMDFGYNVFNNRLKQKYTLDGHDYKRKEKDDFNVNPFRYDVIARIGYGNYTIFASYALSTLFEKDKGPTVYPVSAGIHIDFGN
jgi:hypothetical protein